MQVSFKAFGAKGFATGAARKALGVQDVAVYVICNEDGKWGFYQDAEGKPILRDAAKASAATNAFLQNVNAEEQKFVDGAEARIVQAPVLQMPTLGKPSANVVSAFASVKHAEQNATKEEQKENEKENENESGIEIGENQEGKGSPFGAMVQACTAVRAQPSATTEASNRICKVEKDRPEQNGIKRPSSGGICREIWDFAQSVLDSTDIAPTAKQMRAHGETVGWSMVTTMIQFYQWRKYNGIKGRAPKAE